MLKSGAGKPQDSHLSQTRNTTLLRILEEESFDILASAKARLAGQMTGREYGEQIGLFLDAYGVCLDEA